MWVTFLVLSFREDGYEILDVPKQAFVRFLQLLQEQALPADVRVRKAAASIRKGLTTVVGLAARRTSNELLILLFGQLTLREIPRKTPFAPLLSELRSLMKRYKHRVRTNQGEEKNRTLVPVLT
jgi:hypothetical protein